MSKLFGAAALAVAVVVVGLFAGVAQPALALLPKLTLVQAKKWSNSAVRETRPRAADLHTECRKLARTKARCAVYYTVSNGAQCAATVLVTRVRLDFNATIRSTTGDTECTP